MSLPQDQIVSRLDHLPGEIILQVLESTSMRDLPVLLKASPRANALFATHRKQILVTVLDNILGPVFVDALTFQEFYEFGRLPPGLHPIPLSSVYAQRIASRPENTIEMLKNMSDDKFDQLYQLTQEAQAIAELFAALWRESLKPSFYIQQGPDTNLLLRHMSAPLSDTESRRLVQAIFRAEIFHAFTLHDNGRVPVISLHPSEIEQGNQMACFLDRLFSHVEGEVNYYSPDFQSSNPGPPPPPRLGSSWAKLSQAAADPVQRQALVEYWSGPGGRGRDLYLDVRSSIWIMRANRMSSSRVSPVLGVPSAWSDAMAGEDADVERTWYEIFFARPWVSLLCGGVHVWRQFPLIFWDKWRVDLAKRAFDPIFRTDG
ncbi:hypothetical protein OQA88_7376 [Cercophora sp. LCS_1]